MGNPNRPIIPPNRRTFQLSRKATTVLDMFNTKETLKELITIKMNHQNTAEIKVEAEEEEL